MTALIVVLCFPAIMACGYGVLLGLSRGRPQLLTGPIGLVFYLALLTLPVGVVARSSPARYTEALTWHPSTPIWLLVGGLAGLLLWPVQLRGLPGRTPEAAERVWVGPPGTTGFLLLLLLVAGIVLAEELVWRAYLVPELGLPLSAVAFASIHYHFGLRHLVFSFLAGLVWGGLLVLAETLWPSLLSHLVYNILAWKHMREQAGRQATEG